MYIFPYNLQQFPISMGFSCVVFCSGRSKNVAAAKFRTCIFRTSITVFGVRRLVRRRMTGIERVFEAVLIVGR